MSPALNNLFYLQKTFDSFGNWDGKFSVVETFTFGSNPGNTAVFTINENDIDQMGYTKNPEVAGADACSITNIYWY